MKWKRRASAIVLSLSILLTGCSGILGSRGSSWDYIETSSLREIEPKTKWFGWYQQMEECVSRQIEGHVDGVFYEINWFQTSSLYLKSKKRYVNGVWVRPYNIVLVELDDEWLIKHEMIHDILEGGDHSSPAFKCAALESPY